MYGALGRHMGEIFHELAGHKESKIVEGHAMADHIHMGISIPPKYAVSHVMGHPKGKSAIHIARENGGRSPNFTGVNFWARGHLYRRLEVGEAKVRAFIRSQEGEDESYEQMKMAKLKPPLG